MFENYSPFRGIPQSGRGPSFSKIKHYHKLYSFPGKHIIPCYVIIDCKILRIPKKEQIISPVIALSLKINKPVP
jgi:hypothetical protein